MKKLFLALALAALLPSQASATWSIIAVDLNTGRVVIASATCAATSPDELKLVQAVVVPGMGVAAAQASVDRSHTNQKLIFEQLRAGTHPREIIRLLTTDPRFESRQFGIVDLEGRRAGHSGENNNEVADDIQGESEDGIVYSVQGNIIATEEALENAAEIMEEGEGDMLDRVMLAMEAADAGGGDSRCTCEGGAGGPVEGRPCTGRTSAVAYILAADPEDARGSYADQHPQIPPSNPPEDDEDEETGAPSVCRGEGLPRCHAPWNDGEYHLYIAVYPDNFQPGEDANPVRALRSRYDAWKAASGNR